YLFFIRYGHMLVCVHYLFFYSFFDLLLLYSFPTRRSSDLDYADIITERFGDRVTMWALLNEPNSVAMAGYGLGIHAPGLHAANAVGAAIHHQNLGQGLMAQAARANLKDNATLTTTINLTPIRAAVGEQPQDEAVVELVDAYWNRAFMDPLYDKGYPVAISPNVEPYEI